jgi:hypothetical protein
MSTLSFGAEAEGFTVHYLLDGKGIVKLNQVDILGATTCHVVCFVHRHFGQIGKRVTTSQAGANRGKDSGARLPGETRRQLSGTEHNSRCPFVPGTAVKYRQRLRHHTSPVHLFYGYRLLKMGVGVEAGITMTLH